MHLKVPYFQKTSKAKQVQQVIENRLGKPVVAQVAKIDQKMLVIKDFIRITTGTMGYDEYSKKNIPQTNVLKIDKAKSLVYDDSKKEFFTIEQFDVTGAGDVLQVHGKANSYAFLDPETPKSLLPLCTGSNVKIHGGINVIVRGNAVTRLLEWEKYSESLDYSDLFKKVKNPEGLEAYNFF